MEADKRKSSFQRKLESILIFCEGQESKIKMDPGFRRDDAEIFHFVSCNTFAAALLIGETQA